MEYKSIPAAYAAHAAYADAEKPEKKQDRVNKYALRETQFNTSAKHLGLKLCEESTDAYVYGLWCHSIIINKYKPYVCEKSEKKQEKVNAFAVAWIYGYIPAKRINCINSVYKHIVKNTKRSGTKDFANNWIKYYVQSLTEKDYAKVIERCGSYSLMATMWEFRKHETMIKYAVDMMQWGDSAMIKSIVKWAIESRKSLLSMSQFQMILAMADGYKHRKEC